MVVGKVRPSSNPKVDGRGEGSTPPDPQSGLVRTAAGVEVVTRTVLEDVPVVFDAGARVVLRVPSTDEAEILAHAQHLGRITLARRG